MTTDFLLWQWSLITQLVSGVLIAGFFVAFGRGFATAEMRQWTLAWLANLAALVVTGIDVYVVAATSGIGVALIVGAYLAAKALFVIAMLDGLRLAIDVDRPLWSPRVPVTIVALVFVAGALGVRSVATVSLLAQAMVGVGFTAGMVIAARRVGHPVRWLTIGLALRGLLGILESLAYSAETAPPLLIIPSAAAFLTRLVAVSSFFDASTEWLLALGCVMAATSRARGELQTTNDELRNVQSTLRAMVDVDALTGLANRRALPAILREVQPGGASLVFIDLHDFKRVNDARGHQAGDDVLRRFAAALRDSFRPEDAVVRYAGDEFLVVAQGLTRDAMESRIGALRGGLSAAGGGRPLIQFDAGHAELAPGSLPDDAIGAADAAMFAAKQRAHRRMPLGDRQVTPVQ
jgi:diguanylate cyclase (GGDEF)-like protein